jgi:uncharacterized protein
MSPRSITVVWRQRRSRRRDRCLLLMLGILAVGICDAANRLAGHPSPYLAMHGDDPVDWHPWSAETLAEARAEGKLVFVSSGYFACHWCHVMQRESYQDAKIAAALNALAVPVKIDRELRPALDAHLIAFVEATQGQAGWPLNCFLTPEGYPLVGFTYLPPQEFAGFLARLSRRWAEAPDELRALARRAGKALEEGAAEDQPASPLAPGDIDALRAALARQALEIGDPMTGGFGRINKFPRAPLLAALIAEQARRPDQRLEVFLRLTLDAMSSLGLHDLLGGGFFRYTVDPSWQVPHFEKMLYDNAQLAEIYLAAAEVLDEPRYRDTARETLDFLLRRFRGDDGGFIASLSAVDDRGVEGGYYLWQPQELEAILGEDALRVVAPAWGIEGAPALDAGFLPMQREDTAALAAPLGLAPSELESRLDAARSRLLAVRERRGLPADSKQLAAWNGLMLRALARAARGADSVRYLAAAEALRGYLLTRLWRDGRLLRAVAGDEEIGNAALEDDAYVADGLLTFAETLGTERDIPVVRRLVDTAWQRFRVERGWRLDEDILIPGLAAEPLLADGPLPSAAAVLIDVTLRLAGRTGDEALAQRARAVLLQGHPALHRTPYLHASLIDRLARTVTRALSAP